MQTRWSIYTGRQARLLKKTVSSLVMRSPAKLPNNQSLHSNRSETPTTGQSNGGEKDYLGLVPLYLGAPGLCRASAGGHRSAGFRDGLRINEPRQIRFSTGLECLPADGFTPGERKQRTKAH